VVEGVAAHRALGQFRRVQAQVDQARAHAGLAGQQAPAGMAGALGVGQPLGQGQHAAAFGHQGPAGGVVGLQAAARALGRGQGGGVQLGVAAGQVDGGGASGTGSSARGEKKHRPAPRRCSSCTLAG
jgi:hypothetical protein